MKLMASCWLELPAGGTSNDRSFAGEHNTRTGHPRETLPLRAASKSICLSHLQSFYASRY